MAKNIPYQFNVETKQIIDISQWAYIEAGKCGGSNLVFENKLEYVHNGNIIDAKLKNLEASLNVENDKEIKLRNLSSINNEIKIKEEAKSVFENKLNQIEEDINELLSGKIKGSSIVPVFSPLKFTINLFFLLMLSAYLFLFYVSAIYKALYLNVNSIAQNFANGNSTISVFPEPSEINVAIHNNLVVVFAPFVFYAFGYALHLFLELKSKIKFLWIGLVIAVTLALDSIIALLIHNNVNEAKELVGFNKENWATSSMFWVILLMGFVVYIIWSVLFDGLLKEWKKRDSVTELRRQKNQHKDSLNEIKSNIQSLKNQKDELENTLKPNQSKLISFSVSEMKSSLMLVKDGWMKYLVNIQNSDEKQQDCTTVFNNFIGSKGLK